MIGIHRQRVIAVEPEFHIESTTRRPSWQPVEVGERRNGDHLVERGRDEGRGRAGIVSGGRDVDHSCVDRIADRFVEQVGCVRIVANRVGSRFSETHVGDGRYAVGGEGSHVVYATEHLTGGGFTLSVKRLDGNDGCLSCDACHTESVWPVGGSGDSRHMGSVSVVVVGGRSLGDAVVSVGDVQVRHQVGMVEIDSRVDHGDPGTTSAVVPICRVVGVVGIDSEDPKTGNVHQLECCAFRYAPNEWVPTQGFCRPRAPIKRKTTQNAVINEAKLTTGTPHQPRAHRSGVDTRFKRHDPLVGCFGYVNRVGPGRRREHGADEHSYDQQRQQT